MIFCKKWSHKQFFLKMAERWCINIYFVWKTTIVTLSLCRAFLVVICICVKNHVLLWLNRVNFFQEIMTYAIFSQNGGTLGYKYLFRLKYHYSPLECMSRFFSRNVYLRDKSRSFLLTGRYFVKNDHISNVFPKRRNGWGINIYFVWKTTIVHLSMSSFF